VSINCAAIPDSLLESELFGCERGAFTGAEFARCGHLSAAGGGTVLLDEIGEMTPYAQVKILRALDTREIYRVGSTRKVPLDLRVIAATNQDLDGLIDAGKFRRDLYYRLNVSRVLAVEPNPRLSELLALSLEVNGLTTQTTIVQKAVTDGRTARVRLVVPNRRAACATICREATATDQVVDVAASSVDQLTAEWPQVDLVKVDAEGAEDLIWRGMHRTIERNPGLLVLLEFVPSRYRDPCSFVREIQKAGFSLREVGYDSEIVPVSEGELIQGDEDEGRMLFLRRE